MKREKRCRKCKSKNLREYKIMPRGGLESKRQKATMAVKRMAPEAKKRKTKGFVVCMKCGLKQRR